MTPLQQQVWDAIEGALWFDLGFVANLQREVTAQAAIDVMKVAEDTHDARVTELLNNCTRLEQRARDEKARADANLDALMALARVCGGLAPQPISGKPE